MPTRPPLLIRLTPRWLRDRLRRAVREHAERVLCMVLEPRPDGAGFALSRAIESRVAQVASVDGKHLPIDPGADSYVLPMAERTDPASPDGMPIPARDLWWGYAETAERYLEIGRLNIEKMRSILTGSDGGVAGQCGRDMRPGDRVLDFGCAAGAQIRRLREFAENEVGGEVWGVDISAPHVTWCMTRLPACFRFAITTTSPHLPFEDGHFDLAYCGSVFSHISEMADAWLLELARVLRPGGRLYLTINTKQSMHNYLRWWPTLEFSRAVRSAFKEDRPWAADFAVAVVGRSVWQHSIYNLSVFERKCRQANFRVASVTRNAYSFQTALLLERLETRRPTSAAEESLEVVVASRTRASVARAVDAS